MKKSINKLHFFIYLIFPIFIFSSCYEHEEGCRDTNALNYDVTVDKDCEDQCCNYPNVNITFYPIYSPDNVDTNSFKVDTNSLLVTEYNDTLRIKQLRVFFSNFSLINQNNQEVRLYNSLTIKENDESDNKKINYTVVKLKATSSNYKIGTLSKNSIYNKVLCKFGIDSLINHAIIDKSNHSSPLLQGSDSLHISNEEGFYFLKLIVEINRNTEKTIFIKGDRNLQILILSGELDFSERENHIIPLELNINNWFKDINFSIDKEESISKKLFNNINYSFKILEK